MEYLTFLAVLAVLIILLINISNINGKLNTLLRDVNLLRDHLSKIEKKSKEQPVITPTEPVAPAVKAEKISETKPEPVVADISAPVASSYDDTVKAKLEAMSYEPAPKKPFIPEPPKQPKPKTDFEKFIGENLISKVGIIILVLGVGFFVKYAIDQNWIGVYGRTVIGLLTGVVLISLAHFLRKSFRTFSSLLTGGGLAVFYITIAIAFHQYHIFSQTAAFIIMVLITLFSVVLSLAYDKKELAVFSQFGGYAAPFMISTDGGYIVLFSYMLILNAGLLILAYYKRWHILNLLAFIFTIIIYSGWLTSTFLNNTPMPYRNALLFAAAFYVVFFLANILNALKERKPFKSVEIMMIISNNLFFFLSGIAILYSYEKGIYKGLFTVLIGLFNFGWVVYLYHKKQVDKNLIYLLVALVMSYISLAIPIQLDGHSITLFWTAELVILLWLSQISGIRILKAGHLLITGLVVISIMMDWTNLYNEYIKAMTPIINQAFITGLVVIGGLIASVYFLRKEKEEEFVKGVISTTTYRRILTFMLFVATFVIPFLELNYQSRIYFPVNSFRIVLAGIYIYAYLFVALLITRSHAWQKAFKPLFIISWIALFLYLIVFHLNVLSLRSTYFYSHYVSTGNFLFHYLALPFVVGIVLILNNKKNSILPEKSFMSVLFMWFVSFLLIFIASAELDNILILISDVTWSTYRPVLEVSHKVGYPILWGVCAFLLISMGIKYQKKIYRIQALCLFALIIAKLFLFDVWDMSEGGRIAAFIFLGVVLLVVSFLYQKLKNLFLDKKLS